MDKTYALFSLSFFVLFFYVLTWFLTFIKVIKKSAHRKIWNVMLLIAFVVSGILGLILVVQINYKLDVPWVKKILLWHVDFGILMVLCAFIHLLWHLNYYKFIFMFPKRTRKTGKPTHLRENDFVPQISPVVKNKKYHSLSIYFFAFLLGFSTLFTQIVYIRELFSFFSGNELVIGITLCLWLLVTGLGSYTGKFVPEFFVLKYTRFSMFVFFSLIPLISVILLNVLYPYIVLPGTNPDFLHILIILGIFVFPFCFVSGIVFSFLSTKISIIQQKNKIASVYSFESLGSVISGALLSFVLVFFFSSIQALIVLFVLHVVIMICFSINRRRYDVIIGGIAIIISAFFFLVFQQPDIYVKKDHYPNQTITSVSSIPYGIVTTTEYAGEEVVYLNNKQLYINNNVMKLEEMVHLALCQHKNPASVLVIEGDFIGLYNEILKYLPDTIVYISQNNWLVSHFKDSIKYLENKKALLLHADPVITMHKSPLPFDAVIINAPNPSTAQLNRFYTSEFISHMKQNCQPGAVFVLNLSLPMNYMDESTRNLLATQYNTLKAHFMSVEIFTGEETYFIASDSTVSFNIVPLLESHNIANEYVNKYYYQVDLQKERNRRIMSGISGITGINTTNKPISYYYYLTGWAQEFNLSFYSLLGGAAILFALIFLMYKKYERNMFFAGFTATSYEFIILLLIQVLFGSLYLNTGVVFTFFMLGLGAGAVLLRKRRKYISPKYLALAHGLWAFLLVSTALGMGHFQVTSTFLLVITYVILYSLTLISGILTGTQFAISSSLSSSSYIKTASGVYSADLTGSAAGVLTTSLVFIPLTGIENTTIILFIVNIVFLLYTYFMRK